MGVSAKEELKKGIFRTNIRSFLQRRHIYELAKLKFGKDIKKQ